MNKLQSLETFAPFVSLLGVVRSIVQHLSGFVFFPRFRVLSFVSFLFGFHDGVEGKSLPEDLKTILTFRRGLYT